jgi:hypothetical protein
VKCDQILAPPEIKARPGVVGREFFRQSLNNRACRSHGDGGGLWRLLAGNLFYPCKNLKFRTEIKPLKLLPFCRAIHTCKSAREGTMKTIGYARVSTRDQDLTGQIDALQAAGAGAVHREKISGARPDRPELTKLMKVLAPGDVVLVTKLDRLGRSTRELLELIERIGQAGAFFKSLGDPLFDTATPTGRLLSSCWRRSSNLSAS